MLEDTEVLETRRKGRRVIGGIDIDQILQIVNVPACGGAEDKGFSSLVKFMRLNTETYRILLHQRALYGQPVVILSCHVNPDETDGGVGSVTHCIFVRFTSNLVHLHPLPPPPRKGHVTVLTH